MALDYDEAWRHAEAWIDAFNRRDLDGVEITHHEEMTHKSPYVDRYLGREGDTIEGKSAYREFLYWVWAEQPPILHVLKEVFTGPQGYSFLTHFDHDGTPVVFVREVNADGQVLNQRVYLARPPAG